MKKTSLLTILILVFFNSCINKSEQYHPKEIIIAGRIINYNKDSGKNILTIYINDNSRATQLNYPAEIDSVGNFHVKFKRYYTQDVMLSYLTNFQVIVHPGDSLYVVFDGSPNKRTEIYKTVKYSGSSAELNDNLAIYLEEYFKTRPATSLIRQKQKLLFPNEYKKFQDSIKLSRKIYQKQFIKKYKPGKELKNWINANIELSYFDELFNYPDYEKYKDYPKDWHVDYFNFVSNIPPLTIETLIYADSRWFINQYLNNYLIPRIFNFGGTLKVDNIDSLIFKKIVELTPTEGLLKQLTLTEYTNTYLKKYKLSLFEENRNLINEIITESFLIDPINEHYNEIKAFIEKPMPAADFELNHFEDKTASDIWVKILSDGKGKVLYIDCWGTWCGACLNEIPNAIQMLNNYKDKEVEFVYLCFRSDEKQWKTILTQHKLEGKHYLLNEEQGAYFQQLLGISGYPTYVIIDKKGKIIRIGSSFRPFSEETRNIINDLL